MSEEFELVVKYNAIRLWLDLSERVGFQPVNKKAFLAAVEPEVRKALEEAHERRSREGGHPTSLVDQSPAVGGQLEPSVPVDQVQKANSSPPLPGEDTWGRIPPCEWDGCR